MIIFRHKHNHFKKLEANKHVASGDLRSLMLPKKNFSLKEKKSTLDGNEKRRSKMLRKFR